MSYRVFMQSADQTVQRSLAEQLTAKGYHLAPTVDTADLLLLEADGSPAALCASLRQSGSKQPILLLGLSTEDARAIGADNGLCKPFRFGDLLKILQQVTIRDVIAIGRFQLDENARELSDDQGHRLRLTEKEAAILSYLAKAGDQPVGRDQLLGHVWGYAGTATTHTVETHIYRLRRKLAENGGSDLLRTEEGGYRLSSD